MGCTTVNLPFSGFLVLRILFKGVPSSYKYTWQPYPLFKGISIYWGSFFPRPFIYLGWVGWVFYKLRGYSCPRDPCDVTPRESEVDWGPWGCQALNIVLNQLCGPSLSARATFLLTVTNHCRIIIFFVSSFYSVSWSSIYTAQTTPSYSPNIRINSTHRNN